ncbi:guanylyl cyclase, partial [Cardiosporidium cionae]
VDDTIQIIMAYPLLVFVLLRISFLHAAFQCLVCFLVYFLQDIIAFFIQNSICRSLCLYGETESLPLPSSSPIFCSCLLVSLSQLPALIGVLALAGFVGYRMEYNERKTFLLNYQLELSSNKQTEILNALLPSFVVQEILNSPCSFENIPVMIAAEDCGIVTVIFCDVYDFQNLVANVEPTEIVKFLDLVFLTFDQCAEHFGCLKIETVSECYLCASGLKFEKKKKVSEEDAALSAIEMGISMLLSAAFISTPKLHSTSTNSLQKSAIRETHLRLKIGIHTGRVISGVVGAKKPQFVLFGDTVNTASRMKDTGEVNHIHISDQTHSFVKDDNRFRWLPKRTEVKGKGLMDTFLLEKAENCENIKHFANELQFLVIGISGNDTSPLKLEIFENSFSTPTNLDSIHEESMNSISSPSHEKINSLLQNVSTQKEDTRKVSETFSLHNEEIFETSLSTNGKSNLSNLPSIDIFPAEVLLLNDETMPQISPPLFPQKIAMVAQTMAFLTIDKILPTGAHITANYLLLWAVTSIFMLLIFFLWFITSFRHWSLIAKRFRTRWIIFIINLVFTASAVAFSLMHTWGYTQHSDYSNWISADSLLLYLFITFINHNSGLLFQYVIFIDILVLTITETMLFVVVLPSTQQILAQFSIPTFFLLNSISCFLKEYGDRRAFIVNVGTQEMENRRQELLSDMLPKQVLEEFQRDKLRLAYNHERMSFLFADICGFTAWSKSVAAEEVVLLLQLLFSMFDRETTRLGIYKLCTIGDAYICVSEPTTSDKPGVDPLIGAEKVLQMARNMLDIIDVVRKDFNFPSLTMRIGLHHGACVGGLIGSGRLRYDLWGSDVLTGHMIESHGVPGQICCSEAFRLFLQSRSPMNRFFFRFLRLIDVTDKQVKMYSIHVMNEIDSITTSNLVSTNATRETLRRRDTALRF